MIQRKKTRQIHIGPVAIGGGAPISVQSMTNTKTTDTEATVAQIRALQAAGCDLVRLAVPDMDAAKNLGNIIQAVRVPLIADIHFDYRLAIEAIRQGISALRLNPGNIGGGRGERPRRRQRGEGRRHPNPHRRQRGLSRQEDSREVRRHHAGGARGLGHGACAYP